MSVADQHSSSSGAEVSGSARDIDELTSAFNVEDAESKATITKTRHRGIGVVYISRYRRKSVYRGPIT